MTLHDFTYKFLPQLAHFYQAGELPLLALFDRELWQRLFPTAVGRDLRDGEFLWERIHFTASALADGTLLLVYEISTNPQKTGENKYLALRIRRGKRRKVVVYTLTRPLYYDDPWDIFYLTTPEGKSRFLRKMPGTDWRLPSFCQAIDAIPFDEIPEANEHHSTFDRIKQAVADLLRPQPSE